MCEGMTIKDGGNRFAVEGAHNLRDLGGLRTADGRTTSYGRVFRSGTLSGLTPAGWAAFRALGIGAVFDFRSGPERDHDPGSDARAPSLWQLERTASLGDPKPLLARCLRSAEETRAVMCEVYCRLPLDHRTSYSALFGRLAKEGPPVLFHCSAGKDRTGVATALLLSLLGVERAQIYTDYLQTNDAIEATTRAFLSDPRNRAATERAKAAWQPMMAADARYLDAMFDAVERRYGSVRAYAQKELGLTAGQILSLRSLLLE